MFSVLLRTFLVYGILMLAMRFMGKRQLGQLELSELITAFLLSEIASMPLTNPEIPLMHSLLPVVILVSLEMLLSMLLLKIPALKSLLGARPTVLIRHGKWDRKAMKSIPISAEELISQLRLKDVPDPREVEYAILEPNGQISVILSASARPASAQDASIPVKERGIVHLLISDGQIQKKNLQMSGKDEAWLSSYLKRRGLSPADVFLLWIDDQGDVCLHLKKES
ncbi:MAG: DUF421 domain-containing protein [Clostridia bacterium]|nr:DUF421 domain-containing protein [Clostridia bacterium]